MAEIPSSARGCPSGSERVRALRGGRRSDVVRADRPDPPVQPDSRASPWRATAGAADPDTGVRVAGPYRLAELLGRGATARVWRARDELLDRDVAIKQIDQPHSHGLVEANLAARVRHPHVAGVHDVVMHAGSCWLVMDYHGRASLASLLRNGRRRLPSATTAALGLQLLAALRAVHAAGLVPATSSQRICCSVQTGGWCSSTSVSPRRSMDGGPRIPPAERRQPRHAGLHGRRARRGEAPRPAADRWSLGATLTPSSRPLALAYAGARADPCSRCCMNRQKVGPMGRPSAVAAGAAPPMRPRPGWTFDDVCPVSAASPPSRPGPPASFLLRQHCGGRGQ